MNILVIGSGGREHAVIKSFKKSALTKNIYVLPGNDGMRDDAELISEKQNDFKNIVTVCEQKKIDFVFIGPEEPLVDGLSDELRKNNILCVGPSKAAAQLEGSKIFAKEFMNRANIPTARSFVVTNVEDTLQKASNFTAPYILKADGLAAGKGVTICKSMAELKIAAKDLFIHKKFGLAGGKALLEENLPGKELSFLVLTNGHGFQALPLAQDHKRLLDNDQGPNTGGMGTIAPMKIPDSLYNQIIKKIIEPSILQIEKENFMFRGILFVGIMVVDGTPYALEYNTRFGDPETQVILPLLQNDLVTVFYDLSKGALQPLRHNSLTAVCLVNASEGYPDQPIKGALIKFDESIKEHLLFAGVQSDATGGLITCGGRILNIVATDLDAQKALEKAYAINQQVMFNNRQFRSDIGTKGFE